VATVGAMVDMAVATAAVVEMEAATTMTMTSSG
jgi:hypothetical protein